MTITFGMKQTHSAEAEEGVLPGKPWAWQSCSAQLDFLEQLSREKGSAAERELWPRCVCCCQLLLGAALCTLPFPQLSW